MRYEISSAIFHIYTVMSSYTVFSYLNARVGILIGQFLDSVNIFFVGKFSFIRWQKFKT